MRWSLFLALWSFLVPLGTSFAASSEAFPFKIHEKELPNGLKVLVVPTGFPNLVSLQIPVQTGSRNEIEPGKTGFAHFFEHMMFRGTKKVPAAVYQEQLKKMGARQNAYTSGDYTNYHTTFGKGDLEKMLELEADRFMNLEYGESEFKTEARAVLGEYNKNSANPGQKLWEVTKEAAFTVHPYKHTTMGFLKDIEDMPNQFAYSKTFFDRWYRPEYTTVIIAGDVEPRATFALVEKYFKNWKRGSYKAKIPSEPPPAGPIYKQISWSAPTLPHLLIGFHGPALEADSRDYAALSLLYELAVGETSELYKKLVINEQKVEALRGSASDSRDPDLYTVYAQVKEAGDTALVRDTILKGLLTFSRVPVSSRELDDAKSKMRYGLAMALDNTEDIAAVLASYTHYERRGDTINRLFRSLDSVTPSDVQRVAQRLFTDKNLVISALAQEGLPNALAAIPSLNSLAPQAASARDVKFTVQRSELPLLNIKLLFKSGSASDPEGKEGLAQLAASMISEGGSKAYRYEEIQKALAPFAARFSSQVDKEMSTFTIRVHKDQAAAVVDMLMPSLLDPGFRDEDFQRLKPSQLNNLKNDLRTNNEEELGKERLQELVFSGTPYAHPVLGTIKGIEGLRLDDVRAFIKQHYTQKNLSVGVSGAVDATLLESLQRSVAQLPLGEASPRSREINPPMPKGMSVNIIEKGTRATAISFGHPITVTRSHPDFPALWLARAWLGEHRSSMSHLYERIREVRGMNYGDYAYIEAFPRGMYLTFPEPNVARQAQLFEIWIRPVQPENAVMALRIALFELDKLIKNGLSPEDFESTRAYLTKNLYVMTATQDQQLGYALDSEWYGIPEFTGYMKSQLEKLTVEAVNEAIKRHLSSQNLEVVMITQDAKGLKKQLASDAPSTIRYDGEKPPELLAEDQVIGSYKLNLSEKDISITPVEDVFAGRARNPRTGAVEKEEKNESLWGAQF